MTPQLAWWELPPLIPEPYPHFPETEILARMPEDLKLLWPQFIIGHGVLCMDNGDRGIYPVDFFEFLRAQKNSQTSFL